MYRVNVGISWEPPGQPIIMHWPGDVDELEGWPDLTELVERDVITHLAEAPAEPASETFRARSRRPAISESEE